MALEMREGNLVLQKDKQALFNWALKRTEWHGYLQGQASIFYLIWALERKETAWLYMQGQASIV